MKEASGSKVLLLLPLFFEFARRVRLGVLDWIDRNPGWHVIELDPAAFSMSEEFSRHVDGVISYVFPELPVWEERGAWRDRVLSPATRHRPAHLSPNRFQ